MKKPRPGRRFPLLLYRFAIGHYRRPAMLLAILLLGLWLPVTYAWLPWPRPPADAWLLAGGTVALAFWLFSTLGPRLAYVQTREDHVRLQTPIFRLKIAYRRIMSLRPIDLAIAFPPQEISRGRRRLLEPFYGEPALGVDLRGYPLHPLLMKLFLHPLFLAPDRQGFVLIVPDWMRLSNQIADHMAGWRDAVNDPHRPASDAAAILHEEGD